jgi:hypothetical protein
MHRVLDHVATRPGTSKTAAARAVVGDRDLRSGYDAVARCIRVGLVRVVYLPPTPADPRPPVAELYLTDQGMDARTGGERAQ